MSRGPILKDPDSVLDFTFDYSAWLDSDTISTSDFTVPSGLTKDSDSNTTTTTTIFLSAGTAFARYEIHNRIVTAGGRTDDRSFVIFVQPSWSELGVAAPATLLDCRKMLVDRSGRFDLVLDAPSGNYTDIGANQLINDAQLFLEGMLNYPKRDAWLYKELAVGQTTITFQQARFVQEVYLNASGQTRFKVDKIGMHRMREDYVEPLAASENANTPLVWTPYVTDVSPENPSGDIEGVTLPSASVVSINITAHRFATGDVVFFRNVGGATELNGETYTATKVDADNFTLDSTDGDDFTAWTSGGSATKLFTDVTDTDVLVLGDRFADKSILIMPPTDIAYTAEILCAWKSPVLENNNHRSFWTVNRPALLVRTAMMILETDFHRNTQGRRDYELAVAQEVQQIYHDLIAEEQAGDQSLWIMNG